MGTREKDPRLQSLFKAKKKVYSISKCNTIDECLYEAYNSYILHKKGTSGIYSILGSKVHDKLESIVNGEATVDELPDTLNQELLDLEMLDIQFPKDSKGNDSIRNNWIADMTQFCNTFQAPKGKFKTEELVIYKLSEDRYVQGYVDLIRENSDGTISIYDWKTSTDFKPADLIHHGRQLVFYAMAKEAEGYKVRDVAWIMLKYCQVTFNGKKRSNSKEKTEITKVISRGKLISELKNHIESDLIELGYDELDIEFMIKNAIEENSFKPLPSEIHDKYTVKPYVRSYQITNELRQEAIDYINQKADVFETLEELGEENKWVPRNFTKTTKAGKEIDDTFFCRNLCNFGKTCIHLKRYFDLKEMDLNKEDWEKDLF